VQKDLPGAMGCSPYVRFWNANKRGNFEAVDKQHNEHCFTWQPHGSQFTVIHHVPASAYRFRINRHPPMLSESQVLRLSQFEENWIVPVTLASVTPLKTD